MIKKIVILILVVCNILLGGEKFYGIEMLAKLKNIQIYNMDEPDKKYPNMRTYRKEFKNDYFDSIAIKTDLNNIVYQIRLFKDNIYEAQKILNKLQKNMGHFHAFQIIHHLGK